MNYETFRPYIEIKDEEKYDISVTIGDKKYNHTIDNIDLEKYISIFIDNEN